MRDDYNLAYQLNNLDLPVLNRQNVTGNLYFYNMPINPGINVEWSSSHPDIISNNGIFNPEALTEDTPVDIFVKIWSGNYYWADTLNVTAQPVTEVDSSYLEGIVAYYDFNATRPTNAYNESQRAVKRTNGSGKSVTVETDNVRPDKFFHQYFGSNGNCSFTQFNNPLYDSELEDGLTISFWLKMNEENLWDAIFSFFNSTSKERLYMTGNAYFGYNNDAGNWIDINHPSKKTTGYLSPGKWQLITITLSRTKGLTLYVNGSRKGNNNYSYSGSQNGNNISTYSGFDYNEIIDFIQSCKFFYFGYGSFWGSADICFDDLLIYNKVMTYSEVQNLKKMCNRITNFAAGEGGTGIESIFTDSKVSPARQGIYDLMGRKVSTPVKGNIYIINGEKVLY
jgi:arabinan endo-1,5-alpha-L-arabinosidase